jgi:TonB family protein
MSPSHLRCARTVRLSVFKSLGVAAALAAASGAAHSQAAPAASAPGADSAAVERATREANKVFQWIRIHSDKPRKASAAANAAVERPVAAPATASKVVGKPAHKADSGVTETVQAPPAAAAPFGKAVDANPAPAPASTTIAAKTDTAAPMLPPVNSPPVVEEDMALMPVVKTDPEFPGSLMRQLRKGVVQVSFTVEPDGSVTQAHAVSTTHPRLSPVAIATVMQWRFQPLHHAQQAVVDVGFNLD